MSIKQLKGPLFQEELADLVSAELRVFLSAAYPDYKGQWEKIRRSTKADFLFVVGPLCGVLKTNPEEFSNKVIQIFKQKKQDPNKDLIVDLYFAAGFLNLSINRSLVYKMCFVPIFKLGPQYGRNDMKKGKTVIVEHTSANPNGPLHIGNLRNVIIGGVLSRILKVVGYNVRQHYFVNDLGAQIGLTALGFKKIYDKLEPFKKIDQWIGIIYALMNTFGEVQEFFPLTTFEKMVEEINKKSEAKLENEKFASEEEKKEKIFELNMAALKEIKTEEKFLEWSQVYLELKGKHPVIFQALHEEVKNVPGIKKEAAELNLAYEQNKPEAVKIFRKMVISTLSGIQETLDTYKISHDSFDFESELGWEGSNDQVLQVMKASPFFVPPTQKNEQGVPEGGYLNLAKFLDNAGLPVGKKGYQNNYPNLYVLRPDGSTLYTFRDVVYSLKKNSIADMVLNVIAGEQNLPQEKVALSLQLLGEPRKLFHVSYELVKLLDDHGEEKKMSSRRGRYVLADELYEELKRTIREIMDTKYAQKEKLDAETQEAILHEISTAAMKYTLVSCSFKNLISFNLKKVCDFEDASAPFLLYNGTRFHSILRKYEKGVKEGQFPPLPPIESVDFSELNTDFEWQLFLEFVLNYPSLLVTIACPDIPAPPALPEFPIHLLCDFLVSLVRVFSKFWSSTKILKANPTEQEKKSMFARLYLIKLVQQVLNNGLDLLSMKAPERM